MSQGSICSGQQRAALGSCRNPARDGWGLRGLGSAGGFPASSSGGHEKRRTDTYPGSSQTISFSCSKSASPNGAVLVTEGCLFSCSPPHGFPSPLPFSPNCNYICPILTMQLVKTVTELFPGQLNSNSHRSALSCGIFSVLFRYQQSVVIIRAEDRNTEPLSQKHVFLSYLYREKYHFQILQNQQVSDHL